MHNERDFGVYGSIGFAVAGVEVHFPIGPTLTLFIPCPTTIEVVDDRGSGSPRFSPDRALHGMRLGV
jgi:hypothetical protein